MVIGQSDYEFWFAAPPITYQFIPPSSVLYQNLNRPVRIYFTTAEGPANVTIEQPANPSFTPISVVVNNSTTTWIDLTNYLDIIETKPADSVLNCGLHIISKKRITAQYEVQSPHNAETFTLLGKNGLGYEFLVPSQHHYSNYLYTNPAALNTFEIVATEDSTTVKIVPKVAIVGHPPNDTVIILLNRGQTWNGSAVSGDSSAHIGGSFVFANKPIAVTTSDDALNIPDASSNTQDLAGAQIPPRNLSGTEYAFSLISGFHHYTKFYIYAYENFTSIIYNDSTTKITKTINRGDSIEIRWHPPGVSIGGCYITSNKPILVVEYSFQDNIYPLGWTSPQASMTIPAPFNCTGSKRVVFVLTPPRGKEQVFDISVTAKRAILSSFSFQPQFGLDTNSFSLIPGTQGTIVSFRCTYGAWPLYTTEIISNSKGRFHVMLGTYCHATDTADYSKTAFVSDYSSLYLGPDRSFCPGDSIILDAGFGRDAYLWNTGDTTATIRVNTPGIYWVTTTEEGNCTLSDTIVISYYSYSPINLGPNRQICQNDSTLLNAGSGRNWYFWNTGATTQSIWVKDTGYYWVRVPDIHCIISDTIHISTTQAPQVTNNPLYDTICSGQSTNISLTSNVAGTNFHWTATLTFGNITGFSADSGLVINQVLTNTLPTSGIVTYHITPKIGSCPGSTVDFPVTVVPGDSVKITISASANNICTGTQVTFTAVPTNPGTTPVYQWKVNGSNAGNNSSVFTYTPVNGDQVQCILTSSLTVCISNNPATSNGITMTVNPNLTVSITVTPTQNPVCSGTSVTFTAHPLNEGTVPSYQWKVNGNPVGANLPTYTYIPLNGDVVTCVLNSNIACPIGNPATSNTIPMMVNSNLPASVSITANPNPFCAGSSVTFTATPNNGGTPPSYQWKVNGTNVGTNSNTYSYNPTNGDSVRCVMTSNLACVTNNPASSAEIIMNGTLTPTVTFTSCFDTITSVNAKPIKLKGGIPLNGVYSGPGVSAGIFNPAVAGIGTKSITYTYTNVFLCSASKSRNIAVQSTFVFVCGNNLTDIRDNKVYPTVQIGSQCWMAKNLDYGITVLSSLVQNDNCISEKYCYNDLAGNCSNFGGLYQWDEMMKYDDTQAGQGFCPPGWHVPTENEWQTLFNFYQGNGLAGKPLQDSIISGFNASRSGVFYLNSSMSFNGFATLFWSSTSWGQYKALSHGMNTYNYSVSLYPSSRANAFPVRCLHE
ncbi:MAG: hypothetical protein M0P47_06080 [Bacteroidales bacterium]|nr:hypothetical protein [Bacteroidales bacterium]